MASLYQTLYPMKFLRDYLTQEIRPDGREFLNYRPVNVNVSSITKADASAIYKIGNTKVVCGIKAELAEPKSETPDCGYLIPNVGLTPLCSSKYRPGPPSENAQTATKIIDDILNHSQAIDLRELCICKNKLAWVLYCDLECIDCDGSLIDACIGALMAALSTLTLPEINYNPEAKTTVVHPSNRHQLTLKCLLSSNTFAIYDDELILADPTEEEEALSLSRITIVINENGICFVHKPGGRPISQQLLMLCIDQSKKRSEKICNLIKTAVADL
ncbi:exosome complex component RRP43 [Microplitis demolitor]|uniref:exosome complex component RRP43 n=1 Tax=Microplitis demolitor TaxID=69319 RepID=UPI00043FFE27|nr:exosome complex component RRP43 [Microplitis demolitor]